MVPSGAQAPPVEVGQRERRPGDCVRGRPSLGLRVRERPLGRRRGGRELSVEVVRLRQGCERSDHHVVGLPLGDLDRTAGFRDARGHSFVEGERPNHADAGIDVRRESRGTRCAGTFGELEEATPLDRPGPDEADGGGRGHRQLGMLDELLVRQHLRPADEGAGTAAPDHRQVVVGGDAGDELVIVCGHSVLDRLGHKPSLEKPQGSPPMDLQRGAGVLRFELELCELGEQRVDTEPSRVLQASDEEVRMLQRLERGRRVGASEDAVAELGGEVAETDVRQEPARRLIERAEDSWFR